MRRIIRSIVLCTVLFAGFSLSLAAQEMTAEEKKAEKDFHDSVEREIDRLTNLLALRKSHNRQRHRHHNQSD